MKLSEKKAKNSCEGIFLPFDGHGQFIDRIGLKLCLERKLRI
jgi:hypothetical protein